MIRTQVQLSESQSKQLKRLAEIQGKSVAELIRISVDTMLATTPVVDREQMKERALALAGRFSGPVDLAENHDAYLVEAMEA
jgi:hypothetical protein